MGEQHPTPEHQPTNWTWKLGGIAIAGSLTLMDAFTDGPIHRAFEVLLPDPFNRSESAIGFGLILVPVVFATNALARHYLQNDDEEI